MNPETITAEIRPRSPWEAVDLGVAMVRREFRVILVAWCATVFPVWAAIVFLLWEHPFWALFFLWLLKPLYERVPLQIISGSLFGARPSVWKVLKSWPTLFFKRMHVALLTRRIGMQRSFEMPVVQLEGLRGKTLSQRLMVLNREGGAQASHLTVVCVFFETAVYLALSSLWASLFAGAGDLSWAEMGYGVENLGMMPNAEVWKMNFIYMIAMTLIEPFYVGGGFGLYLNSRTHLEGWDIELAFKRMSLRLRALKAGSKSAAALLIAGAVALAFSMQHAQAQSQYDTRTSHDIIKEIKEHPDFEIHTRIDKRLKSKEPDFDSDSSGSGVSLPAFQAIGDALFWLVVAALVAGLVYLIYKNRHIFKVSKPEPAKRPERASSVMGMNVEAQSLPRDIVAAARQLWQAGETHEAMRLLYRGAISWFVNRAQLPVRESDTESDCLDHARGLGDSQKSDYFADLTNEWIKLAYGKMEPTTEGMSSLLGSWPFAGKHTPGRSETPEVEGGEA